MGKPVGVRVPPSAPVEIRRRSENLGAFSISTGAPRGLEPASGTDRAGRKSATLVSASARSRAATGDGAIAEPHAVESPLRHHPSLLVATVKPRLRSYGWQAIREGCLPKPWRRRASYHQGISASRQVPFSCEIGPSGSFVARRVSEKGALPFRRGEAPRP